MQRVIPKLVIGASSKGCPQLRPLASLAWFCALLILAGCSTLQGRPPLIEEFFATPSRVKSGGSTVLAWEVLRAETIHLTSDAGLDLDITGETAWAMAVDETTRLTLIARNASGEATRGLVVEVAPVDPGEEPSPEESKPLLILVAGQSNAVGEGEPFPEGREVADEGVYMLSQGPSVDDWRWVVAEEPSHTYPEREEHSFVVRLGNELTRAAGRKVYLVPSAVGGTAVVEWLPDSSSGYFERAVERAAFAASDLGVPVTVVAWFQGETDSRYSSYRRQFEQRTRTVFEAFHARLPGSPPIVYAQIGKKLYQESQPARNLGYQVIREVQRTMEPGTVASSVVQPGGEPSGNDGALSYLAMVVTHDLPMSDHLHVSSEGQKIVGSRFAHAFLTNFWSDQGNRAPTRRSPRLVRVERAAADLIRVTTTRAINKSTTYDGYFALFVDGTAVEIGQLERDPSDDHSILMWVTTELPEDASRIEVRYMPPDEVGVHTATSEAVHAVDEATGLRLPLPAFGSPVETVPSSFLQLP